MRFQHYHRTFYTLQPGSDQVSVHIAAITVAFAVPQQWLHDIQTDARN
jgi:hypothetical protein